MILFALLYTLDQCIDFLADALSLRSLTPEIPIEVKTLRPDYTGEVHHKATAYQKERFLFSMTHRAVGAIAFLIFYFLSGFSWLSQMAQHLAVQSVWQAVAFVILATFLRTLIQLPFSLYSTFRIEQRHGFNRTTPKLFLTDLLKQTVIGLVIGIPILAALFSVIEHFGEQSWAWAFALTLLIQIIFTALAPTLIMPLFNRFEPLPDGELKLRLVDASKLLGFSIQGIYTMDGSKRSSKANAFFAGFGPFRKLVLFDTLVKNHPVPEVVSVFAHEVGHFKKGHIVKNLALAIPLTGFFFYLAHLSLESSSSTFIRAPFGFPSESHSFGLIAFYFWASIAMRPIGILMSWISRTFEFEADSYSIEKLKDPESMKNALLRLSQDHLSNWTPHPLKVILEYSHPPTLERVQAIAEATQQFKNRAL